MRLETLSLFGGIGLLLVCACTVSDGSGDEDAGGKDNEARDEDNGVVPQRDGGQPPESNMVDASSSTSLSFGPPQDGGGQTQLDAAYAFDDDAGNGDASVALSQDAGEDAGGGGIDTSSTTTGLDFSNDSSGESKPVITRIESGVWHDCRLSSSGEVECRGDGRRGQLGAAAFGRSSDDWVIVDDLPNPAIAVDVGLQHSCALLSDGTVHCWGYNQYGQLGDGGNGDVSSSEFPVQVVDLENVVGMSAGGNTTCALLESGEVSCWGSNVGGILGNGSVSTPTESSVPLTVAGIEDVAKITVGTKSACALLNDGRILCWGNGDSGRLGNGETTSSGVPGLVQAIDDAVDVSVASSATGVYDSACAVRADGSVWCWGDNHYHQLGEGSVRDSSSSPVQVEGAPSATKVSVGATHVCLVEKETAAVWCWGDNSAGQLGTGNTQSTAVPTLTTAAPNDASDLSAGNEHTCGVRRGLSVCWGR